MPTISQIAHLVFCLEAENVTLRFCCTSSSSTYALGNNTKPLRSLNHNKTVDVWVAGFGWIRPGEGTGALLFAVYFGARIGGGVDEPEPNRDWRAKFDQSAPSNYSNIPQSTIGWLGFGRISREMKRRLRFVAGKIQQKFNGWGGGLAIAKSCPAGRILSMRPVKIFKNSTTNHRVAGLWLNRLGDGKAAPFCGPDYSMKIQLFWGGVSLSQITFSRSNSIGPPSQHIQTYHNQPSGGWALAELAGGWKGGSILWP